MNRLAGWDFPSRLSPALPTAIAQIVFALLVTTLMIVIRTVIDVVAPGAGALSLLYPAVMVATLFGRSLAGVLTLIGGMSYTISFVLPLRDNLAFENPADLPRVIVNIVVLSATIALLEIFRRAVAQANAERDHQIELGKLLLRELDHRVKNNFMAVGSLLQLQRQRASHALVHEALDGAIGRVEGLATAHRFLYREGASSEAIEMQVYLGELCAALEQGLLQSRRIKLEYKVDPVTMQRDRAIALGLVVSELVTNAAKHAFPGEREGTVAVSLRHSADGLLLAVEDDGGGISEEGCEGGLGRRLVGAFVEEARGSLTTESSAQGTRCLVRLR